MRQAPLLNLVLAVALVIMTGWLLIVGRGLLLPVITAVICVYVLTEAAAWLGRIPVTRNLPNMVRLVSLLAVFTLLCLVMGMVVMTTVDDILVAAPRYQANLESLIQRAGERYALDLPASWDDAFAMLTDRINLQGVLLVFIGWITRFGLSFFLILVYAAFMLAEWGRFPPKLRQAFPDPGRAASVGAVVAAINGRIGHYLALKTLINAILGVLSYAIMWWFQVDFALFWAILIALTNYIPYVGGIVGVAFPVILSLAQFGSFQESVVLCLLLTGAQVIVGSFLEPMLMGRHLNLSPFVIIVSLSVWASLWGIPGAILAIPMTSMMMIVLAQFPATRFLAVMLSETGEPDGQVPLRPNA